MGKEWTTVEPDSENKLVRGRVGKEWTTVVASQTVKISWFESQGALPALAFLGEIRVFGWFVN